jgi:hypothetical protein
MLILILSLIKRALDKGLRGLAFKALDQVGGVNDLLDLQRSSKVLRRWKWMIKKVLQQVTTPALAYLKRLFRTCFAPIPYYQQACKTLLTFPFQIPCYPLPVKP